MWKCHKCGKPVYFAERKQSLGYDWHPECLRCEECGKRLNPGQHAEHKGIPYCHIPCYGALFGPQLYGHGTRVESHTSFGKVENKTGSHNMPRSHLESKLKVFNQFYDGKSGEVKCREVNGRLVLEGVLRIYWGVSGVIHLKEDDDQRTVVTVRKRNSCRNSLLNGFDTKDEAYSTVGNGVESNVLNNKNEEDKISNEEASCQTLSGKCLTLPPKLDLKNLKWDELDILLQVERPLSPREKMYQTLPVSLNACFLSQESFSTTPSPEDAPQSDQTPSSPYENDESFPKLTERGGMDRSRSNPENVNIVMDLSSEDEVVGSGVEDGTKLEEGVRKKSSAIIRRRRGVRGGEGRRKRRRGGGLKRRCSINGHFYNRETSFFTPPFGSQMSVWVTSLVSTQEVINLMLDKYKVVSSSDNFALFIVRDNGEQRMLKEEEYPLLVRVMLGPHEDVAKLYLMDRGSTEEISSEVAQFLNLSTTECKAILERYSSEQACEERRILAKYKEMHRRIKQRMEDLKVRL